MSEPTHEQVQATIYAQVPTVAEAIVAAQNAIAATLGHFVQLECDEIQHGDGSIEFSVRCIYTLGTDKRQIVIGLPELEMIRNGEMPPFTGLGETNE